MSAKIDFLFSEPDNVEIIRDEIAVILSAEFKKQYKMACDKNLEDCEDFNVKVYLEDDRPFALPDGDDDSIFPFVNVNLNDMQQIGKSGGIADKKKYEASFYIDCYTCGNFGEASRKDSVKANILAWKIARVVRNILMSGHYAYLGYRGMVLGRNIPSIKSGNMSGMESAAFAVSIARVEFKVSFAERSICEKGVPLEGVKFKIDDKVGEVLVNP